MSEADSHGVVLRPIRLSHACTESSFRAALRISISPSGSASRIESLRAEIFRWSAGLVISTHGTCILQLEIYQLPAYRNARTQAPLKPAVNSGGMDGFVRV